MFKKLFGGTQKQVESYEPPAISSTTNSSSSSNTPSKVSNVIPSTQTNDPPNGSTSGSAMAQPSSSGSSPSTPSSSVQSPLNRVLGSGRGQSQSKLSMGSNSGSSGSLFGGMNIKTMPSVSTPPTTRTDSSLDTLLNSPNIKDQGQVIQTNSFNLTFQSESPTTITSGETLINPSTLKNQRSRHNISPGISERNVKPSTTENHGSKNPDPSVGGGRRRGGASAKIGRVGKSARTEIVSPPSTSTTYIESSLQESEKTAIQSTQIVDDTNPEKMDLQKSSSLDFDGLEIKSRSDLFDANVNQQNDLEDNTKNVHSSVNDDKSSSILQHFAKDDKKVVEPKRSLHEILSEKWEKLRAEMRLTFENLYNTSTSLQNNRKELFEKKNMHITRIDEIKSEIEAKEGMLNDVTQNEDYDAAEKLTQEIDNLHKEVLQEQETLQDIENELVQMKAKRDNLPNQIMKHYSEYIEKVQQLESEQQIEFKEFNKDAEIKKTYTEDRLQSEKARLSRIRESVQQDLEDLDIKKKTLQKKIDDQTVSIRSKIQEHETLQSSLQLEINDLKRKLKKKEDELANVLLDISQSQKEIEKVKRKFKKEYDDVSRQEKVTKERELNFFQQEREYTHETSSMEKDLEEIHRELTSRRKILSDMSSHMMESKIYSRMIGKQVGFVDCIRKDRESFDLKHKDTIKQIVASEKKLLTHQEKLKATLSCIETTEIKIERIKKQLNKIEGRIPFLEEEKQQAAEKRQFREAGRLHKEIKELEEKETLLDNEQVEAQTLLKTTQIQLDELLEREKVLIEECRSIKQDFEIEQLKQVLQGRKLLEFLISKFNEIANAKLEGNTQSSQNIGLQLLEIELDAIKNEELAIASSLKIETENYEKLKSTVSEDLISRLQEIEEELNEESEENNPTPEENSEEASVTSEKSEENAQNPEEDITAQEVNNDPAINDELRNGIEEKLIIGDDENNNEVPISLSLEEIKDRIECISQEVTRLEECITEAVAREDFDECALLQSQIDDLFKEREHLQRAAEHFGAHHDHEDCENVPQTEVNITPHDDKSEESSCHTDDIPLSSEAQSNAIIITRDDYLPETHTSDSELVEAKNQKLDSEEMMENKENKESNTEKLSEVNSTDDEHEIPISSNVFSFINTGKPSNDIDTNDIDSSSMEDYQQIDSCEQNEILSNDGQDENDSSNAEILPPISKFSALLLGVADSAVENEQAPSMSQEDIDMQVDVPPVSHSNFGFLLGSGVDDDDADNDPGVDDVDDAGNDAGDLGNVEEMQPIPNLEILPEAHDATLFTQSIPYDEEDPSLEVNGYCMLNNDTNVDSSSISKFLLSGQPSECVTHEEKVTKPLGGWDDSTEE